MKLGKNDPETKSKNIPAENIETLKQLFPSIVEEGKVNFDALRQLLGDTVVNEEEYYRFTWPGKHKARQEALKTSTGTLRPAKEDSVDWDTTENLYIEGDNLEVLKLLQKSYFNKVKMIYIDPPYNTGKDFVYKDKYGDNLSNFLENFNRTDEDGNVISSETNNEGNAKYHSNWLNMMYPRLQLARTLLKDDGVIFISIDDHEVSNLRKICDEIFGEENFVTLFIWKKKQGGGNDSNHIVIEHEYILLYSKNKVNINILLDKKYELSDSLYPFSDEHGDYGLITLDKSSIRFSESLVFPIYDKNNNEYYPRIINGKQSCWRWGKEKVKNEFDKLVFKNDKVYTKYYRPIGVVPKSLLVNSRFGRTETGNDDIKKIFDRMFFSYPKPLSLIKHFVSIAIESNDIILDFFSGSATTAQAVMDLNKEDALEGKEGKRKYIMVQLPEPTEEKSEAYKAGYKTIAEIGKERIRRASKQIKEELKEKPEVLEKLDLGFKVFKLDSSNIKAWDNDPEELENNLFQEEVIKDDRTAEDVLYEVLIKYGLDLTLPIEEVTLDNKAIYSIGAGQLIFCLEDGVTRDTAQAIIDWAKENEVIDPKIVFKDSGFTNDVEKTNIIQLFKTHEILDVKSI